jgi:LmbE family N-acetylglucosaminyl deacetylase
MRSFPFFQLFSCSLALFLRAASAAPPPVLITDLTNYNVGAPVIVRFGAPGTEGTASVRYAGDSTPIASGISLRSSADYQPLWTIPPLARTGRYLIDLSMRDGSVVQGIGSFAVHRQLAKVIAFELDKTFYTAGDAVSPRITVQNISDQALSHLQVEFEAYTYPWIAPATDEPPGWKAVADSNLSLRPGEIKEFRLPRAAVVQVGSDGAETYAYFSAVIRDAVQTDRIYDLAFSLPAITSPASSQPGVSPKAYPSLYLYHQLKNVPDSESYRQFYPAGYVSDVIQFDTAHTMFATGKAPEFFFQVVADTMPKGAASARYSVLDRQGKGLQQGSVSGAVPGSHSLSISPVEAGAYTLRVAILDERGVELASNRLDFALNPMPKSILVFAAHQDDDTAHPQMIRAAVENHIPIHFVYFTSGDAGGCDRYFQRSCDASRAMEFGEVRMNEARASLGHLGVKPEDIFFLGLPDGGMEQIWKNFPDSAKPYLSVLLASEHSPYSDVAVPNLPYAKDAVLRATREFLLKYQPDMVITGHPDERHVDHRTNNWFVVKAMQGLVKEGKLLAQTQLVVDAVYGPAPGIHAPYRFEKYQFYESGEEAKLGQEALWYYQSQDGNHQQAEIIPYAKMPREWRQPHYGVYIPPYPHFRILDWTEHPGWNEQ